MTLNTNRKNVTISDVARAAGVSKTTVSRYINGKYSLMSPDTRKRIETVIEMSGFRPNSIAQSLKSKQSYQIGVVVADISSPFSSTLIRGIGDVLGENGYVSLFADSKSSLELENKFVQALVSRRVDGLIVNTSDCNNPALIQLACQGFPVVLCDRYVNDYNFNFVGSEVRLPILEVLSHLREEGFARPAFLTQPFEKNSARFLRRDAYLEGMAVHYPNEDADSLCFVVDPSDRAFTIRCLERLLSGCACGEVPVVIAVNTVTTMHVIAAIHDMGLSIPEQIGVCGPDDWGMDQQIDWPSIVSPGITTFTVHPYEIGCTVAQLLLDQIKDPDRPKQSIRTPSELVIRGSTRLREAQGRRASGV